MVADDRFGRAGRQVLADEVGTDRQLAVAPVDQHGELDGARASVVADRVERGPHGAAGVQHVVDEHDGHAGDVEAEVADRTRRDRPKADVVAVEAGVDRADRNGL